MTIDLESAHSLECLDRDALPRYSRKAPNLSTLSAPYHLKMADSYTTIQDYFHFCLILACLIAGLGSMPFIDLCQGGGALAGSTALSTGICLLFYQYWKVGVLCQNENNPRVPTGWNPYVYYSMTNSLPIIFGTLFGFVLLVVISHCCNALPPNHRCISTLPTSSPSPPPSTPPVRNQGSRLSPIHFQ